MSLAKVSFSLAVSLISLSSFTSARPEPPIFFGGHEQAGSLDSYGAQLGSIAGGSSHEGLSLGGQGGSYEVHQDQGEGGAAPAPVADGGDYHHGVSVVGGGGQGQGTSFDLTKHGGGHEHQGTFGGTFVASAKYEGAAAGGHKGHADYSHYSDVLRASEDDGGAHHESVSTDLGGGEHHFY